MKCTFSLVRYCHDPRRGEFVNFGLLLHTTEPVGVLSRFSSHRIQRIKRLYSDVDENLIKTIQHGIESSLEPFRVQEGAAAYAPPLHPSLSLDGSKIRLLDPGYLEYLSRYHNGIIQFSPPQPLMTDDVRREFDRVYNLFVADPDELIEPAARELPNTIHQRLRAQLQPVKQRLDLDYELKRDAIEGLMKGTTLDFIGCNGKIVCGKSIDFENHGVEGSAQAMTILIQVFDALHLTYEQDTSNRGQYYVVTKAPPPKDRKLYQIWMKVDYWSRRGFFKVIDIDEASQIAEYVQRHNVQPFSLWLKERRK